MNRVKRLFKSNDSPQSAALTIENISNHYVHIVAIPVKNRNLKPYDSQCIAIDPHQTGECSYTGDACVMFYIQDRDVALVKNIIKLSSRKSHVTNVLINKHGKVIRRGLTAPLTPH